MKRQVLFHSQAGCTQQAKWNAGWPASLWRAGLCVVVVAVVLSTLLSPVTAVSAPTGPSLSAVAAWNCSGVYHTVQAGESIYSIARRYGSTAYRIANCNGLASYTVYVGQSLLVPIRPR